MATFSNFLSGAVGQDKYNQILAKNPLNRNLGQAASLDIQTIFNTMAQLGDPRINAVLANIMRQVDTAAQGATRGAALRGARLGQDVSASIGAIGAGSTGAGAVARGLARSSASSAAGQAMQEAASTKAQVTADIQQQYLMSLLGGASQIGSQTALSKYQGDLQYKIAKMGQPSGWEKFAGALGAVGGVLPWGQWFPGKSNTPSMPNPFGGG